MRRRAGAWRAAWTLAAVATLALPAGLRAAPGSAAPAAGGSAAADSGLSAAGRTLPARVTARPARVNLAQPVTVRAWVLVPRGTRAQWLPPESGGALTWSPIRARRAAGARLDTLVFESDVLVFATGPVTLPGPAFRLQDSGARRLPGVRVMVMASAGIADSSADLRPLRGPLAAPWWERVPWRWVILGAALLAAGVALVVAWRRRRRRPALVTPAAARAALDPGSAALAELETLRRLRLPEQGLHADHALALTRIARRFLEATAGTPRPGDTTPELVHHLEAAALDTEEVARLATLLGWWDRVKFARAGATVAEAHDAEAAVEDLVRRWAERRAAERAVGGAGSNGGAAARVA